MGDAKERLMNPVKKTKFEGLQQKDAYLLARVFNITFNNVTVYGGNHPSFQKTVKDLSAAVTEILNQFPLITIMLERGSVFIEQWCIDKRISQKKITAYFKKAGIESISFKQGASLEEIFQFMAVIGDIKQYPTAEAMKKALAAKKISAVLLNYVAYQKVTKDETIVSRDQELKPGRVSLDGGLVDHLVDDGLGRSFSLISEGLENNDGLSVAEQIKAIRKDLDEKNLSEAASTEEVLDAVVKLKDDLQENLEIQKELGKVLGHEDKMITELDRLSLQVILKLVKEEYTKEKISIKRLAQIIRRLLPKAHEIKRIFPALKEALIDSHARVRRFAALGLSYLLRLDREEMRLDKREVKQLKGADANSVELSLTFNGVSGFMKLAGSSSGDTSSRSIACSL